MIKNPPLSRRHALQLLGSGLLVSPVLTASANDYPTKPVELVVPAAAGGGSDALARTLADVFRKYFPQPLLVNNKPGASGSIGMTDVLNSKPDGYKVAMVVTELVILPHLGTVKFTHADFTLVALLNADPAAVTVRSDAKWNTVEEFLADARARPGQIKSGNSGPGSIWHVAAVGLEDRANIKLTHVPFQGAAPAVVSLLGGHIDAVTVSPAEVSEHVKAGRLKMLGIMADRRIGTFDKVPTLKERNVDVAIAAWRGLAVPKDTPASVVESLRTATRRAAEDPAFRESLAKLNLGYAYLDAPEFANSIRSQNDLFKSIVGKLDLKS
jgi:tripartite-type tricarboxylate transporter receptor subunit TctC